MFGEEKRGIKPHRNTINLAEDLRANSEMIIKKKISNSIFHLLFVKTYYIIFNIFLPNNLVYQIEKSKVEAEVAFLRLLSPFIASMAGLLYPKSVTEKKLCLILYVCNCLKKKQKIDVLAG